MVTSVDRAVGEILDALDALALANETLVLFFSDNGPENGAGSAGPFRGRKRDVFEGGLATPAFARMPGALRAGATSARFILGTDVFATALAALGLGAPRRAAAEPWPPVLVPDLAERGRNATRGGGHLAHAEHAVIGALFDGINQWPALIADARGGGERGGGERAADFERAAVWMSGFTHLEWKWAARRRGLKLLATASLDRLMLFNLSADPHEQEDLLAASGDGALALAGEVAALRDVIVAVRAAPQRHYATDPRRDLCHVGRLEEISTFSHVAPAGI